MQSIGTRAFGAKQLRQMWFVVILFFTLHCEYAFTKFCINTFQFFSIILLHTMPLMSISTLSITQLYLNSSANPISIAWIHHPRFHRSVNGRHKVIEKEYAEHLFGFLLWNQIIISRFLIISNLSSLIPLKLLSRITSSVLYIDPQPITVLKALTDLYFGFKLFDWVIGFLGGEKLVFFLRLKVKN